MLEVVISIFVILIGLLGVLSLMSNNLKTTMLSRDQIVASQLAQEGTELVRFIRDNNIASSASDQFLHLEEVSGSDQCVIFADSDLDSWSTSSASFCNKGTSSGGPYALYLNQATGFYGSSSTGIATKFSRRISIIDEGSSDKKVVISVVSWNGSYPPESDCSLAKKCVAYKTIIEK